MTISLMLQYLMPQRLLSRIFGKIARCRIPSIKNFIIKNYYKYYKIDLSEAREANYRSYGSFGEFFTRALKAEARPLAAGDDTLLAPVDGTIYQLGRIQREQIIYAKGRGFTLQQLLGNSEEAQYYEGGAFMVIYLSPADYHRIHMPLEGELRNMRYIPGELFSVNPSVIDGIPQVFARNERVVTNFSCALGAMALVFVGAMIVGSIETVWSDAVVNHGVRKITDWNYQDKNMKFRPGEEIGRFNLGSTVILLFPRDMVRFSDHLNPRSRVKMGAALGKFIAQ